ncbi:MAG: hypothetical protein AAF514_12325 [Verrucomicrobiota bacterium]
MKSRFLGALDRMELYLRNRGTVLPSAVMAGGLASHFKSSLSLATLTSDAFASGALRMSEGVC